MSNDTKIVILYALRSYRGDDYERAKAAFKNLSSEQMKALHGASGRSRQEVLDGYAAHVEMVDKAIKEVELM